MTTKRLQFTEWLPDQPANSGAVAIFIWPKKQLQKIYSNFGFTFNTGN